METKLTPQLLLFAYSQGVFPMAQEDGIYWYDPDPRTILPLESFHVPRRLGRTVRSGRFEVRVDTAFRAVMAACAEPAPGRESTWISPEFVAVYTQLHQLGFAHSVESWRDGQMVGGLYGVAIRGLFAGESMFSHDTDASKVALVTLVAAEMLSRGYLDLRRTGNQLAARQAHYYALGAEAWARQVLARDFRDDEAGSPGDDLSELWATELVPFDIDEGEMAVRIEDLSGRFNLNNLVDHSGKPNSAQVQAFQRLLATLDLPRSLAAAVTDWLDRDTQPLPGGAEDPYYSASEAGYLTANRPLADVSELRLVAGVDAEVYAKLEPYVAALGPGTPVNINTAKDKVLQAIYSTLSGSDLEQVAGLRPETLSVKIRATNGSLPRERLQEGMITGLAPDVPQIVEPTNLRAPSLIQYPPQADDPDYFWKLIAHLSLNHRSLASREALLGLLELYDWTESGGNRRRLAGLREVRWDAKEVVERGAVLRGAEVTLEVDQGHFADAGDLCLFGLVLSEFLSAGAAINAFVHLKIVLIPSGKTYTWQPRRGAMPVL